MSLLFTNVAPFTNVTSEISLPFCVQISSVHRTQCTSLDLSRDGQHLVTAGDKVLKVWDYKMRLDVNFQVRYITMHINTARTS